jgi:crossover junction endodeoxyribonuclease RuvC
VGLSGGLATIFRGGKVYPYLREPWEPGINGLGPWLTMPRNGKDIDAARLFGWLQQLPIDHAYVELVHAMPKQGVTSSFKFGETLGVIKGVLGSAGIPVTMVSPQKWQKVAYAGVTGEGKERSLIAASRLFPGFVPLETERCRKPHSGVLDALLIAYAGARL